MFSQVSVCPQQGVHGRGACMVGVCAWVCVHGCVWGACMVGACVARGICVVGGMHGRGHVWQGACMAGACVAGGVHGRRDGHCS